MRKKKDAGPRTVAVVHVALRVAGALAVRLEHADGGEDLRLGEEGHVVPLLEGRAARDVAPVGRDGVLAGNKGRAARDEAEERGHGDAAVLNLGVAEVADRRLVAEAPEVALGDEVEGVPEADGPAEEVGVRLGEGLHLLLAVQGRARGRRHGRDERRGAAEREGGDDLLHRFRFCGGQGRVILSLVSLALSPRVVSPRPGSLSLRHRGDGAARARSATATAAALCWARAARLCWAPGDGDGPRSVGAEWVPRPPQAGAAFSQALEASPPANGNRCRASARYVSDTQPWMIDGAKVVVSGPLEALFALRRRLMTSI